MVLEPLNFEIWGCTLSPAVFTAWGKACSIKTSAVLRRSQLIGHYETESGLKVDPDKVRAILEMPRPTHVKSLLRFNGTVHYLVKFLPHLSEFSLPLR